ncbi:MAG: SPASM domain-containing protein, partial [bacterium]|nr:SPASM domain-containing protein [bacterium]
RVEPDGDLLQLREDLKQAGLIFECDTVVPFKIEKDPPQPTNRLFIRELQIKLSGPKETNCRERKPLGTDIHQMDISLPAALKAQLTHIEVAKIRIEATPDVRGIEYILSHFECEAVEVHTGHPMGQKDIQYYKDICEQRNIVFTTGIGKRAFGELNVNVDDFFYSQKYNSCYGHQVAVDTDGDIRPCLWASEVLGNIGAERIGDIILSGGFDRYWELTKDKIEGCKDCERRYACADCRVSAGNENESVRYKPSLCSYNPYNPGQ